MHAIKRSIDESGEPEPGGDSSVDNENFVPRNDPYDCYKPNSDDAVYVLATTPNTEKLEDDETHLLREVAADMDLKLYTDEIEGFPRLVNISEESRTQLERLPSWLQAMIRSRWDIIHTHYGHSVHNFLRMIANRIDTQYRTQYLKVIGNAVDEEDELLEEELHVGYALMQEDLEVKEPDASKKTKHQAAFGVAKFVGKFKAHHYSHRYWEAHMIKRAESVLRTAMITKASSADIAIIAEEDNITALGKSRRDDSDSEDEGHANVDHWDKYEIEDREKLQQEAKEAIELTYHLQSTDELSRDERKALRIKKKMVQLEKNKKKVSYWSYLKSHPLFSSNTRRKERKKMLLERALYRRYSRIWYKGCGEPIQHTKKSGHQFRTDERFHSYIVSLVTWSVFKNIVMCVIVANAILLAIETGDVSEDMIPVFEIFDVFFLSLYTVEFLLKIYAHPYRYWKSGYNVFDFLILIVSITKKMIDWMGYEEKYWLKLLTIFRALRILRGVSLSVQMQVLVTALAETIKTHVLSVILLLILLLYISSIVAFYFFGSIKGLENQWGKIGMGMYRMFTFVTMDGWTELIDKFNKPGMFHSGRVFGVIGIVLGNFLFSNIFVAIIIMQISEATDSYREKQIEEREEIVCRKKDIVFRRQKLDMRQLLARQKMSISADFFHMGSQFQRLLRHDDLVAMQEVCTSPLWMDCLYKTLLRCHNTSNILMNLHRELADALLEGYDYHAINRYEIEPIRRGRYNRYMVVKAKLALIKREIYRHRHPERKHPVKIRLPPDSDDENQFVDINETQEGEDNKQIPLENNEGETTQSQNHSDSVKKVSNS